MKIRPLAVLFLLTVSQAPILCKPPQITSEEQTAKVNAVKKLLESRKYRFIPQSFQTQTGRTFQVNNYWLDIRNDSLVSNLPYSGVAHSPQIGSGKGPLNFTSTDFTYASEARRKGNTSISILLDDKFIDAQEFYLNISSTGYSTLKVRFNSRQSVSFDGEIRRLPAKR